jgi:hypothetical protein
LPQTTALLTSIEPSETTRGSRRLRISELGSVQRMTPRTAVKGQTIVSN